MIGFIKTHLISLISGLVILASFGLAMWFMSSTEVETEMDKVVRDTGATQIRSLMSNPKNEEIIKAAENRGKEFAAEFQKTVERAIEINARTPLMDGVFPEADSAPVRTKFAEEYERNVTRQLAADLKAGQLPSAAEIAEEEGNVYDLWTLLEERRIEEGGEEEGRQPQVASANPAFGPSGGMRSPGGMGGGMRSPGGMGGGMRSPGGGMRSPGGMTGGGMRSPGGMSPTAAPTPTFNNAFTSNTTPTAPIPTDDPKFNPIYRARVAKAKSIRCYIGDPFETFHVSPIIGAESSPLPADMWTAQVGLWIQEDVVKAIANLNDKFAQRVTDGQACVEQVPIKRLIAIRVFGYDMPTVEAGNKPETPTLDFGVGASSEASFSKRKSGDLYDVIRFQVTVVVDQREVLRLIDEMAHVNFYLCTGVSYETVDRYAEEMGEGYFYGTAPVVRAVYDFEGYMLRDAYAKWMPKSVREALGIKDEANKDD